MRRALALGLSLVALSSAGPVAASRRADADAAVARLADRFVDGWLERRPQLATRLGVHTWDDRLRPVTQASVVEDAAWLADLERRLAAIPRTGLSPARALDHDLLAARLARERLELEEVRGWERNPGGYVELIGGSIQLLVQREFASPAARLRSVTGRLRLVPEVLRAARINLRHPPRVFTEIAIGQVAGVLRLYREDLPAFARRVRDGRLEGDFVQADSAAVRAVEAFLVFLREDLLPGSDGDFRLGRDLYQKKLAVEELEGTPVDTLLARALAALDGTRARMERVAERIAPGRGVAAALDSLARGAPAESSLVPAVAGGLGRIRAFLSAHALVTPPASENLRVRETPAFRRGTSFASMEPPGVWETRASEAFYNVTPPETGWSEAQKRDHLGIFNPWSADIVSIHEAIPGHYYQLLAARHAPSRLRQGFGCGTSIEGWAHYCEQMAVEQGWGDGDPRVELAQLDLALQRLGRMVVGLSMHTGTMTLEEGARLFEERCGMPRVNAEREARRGAVDPTYLVYTLGKWRILELREELRRRLGARFDLRAFHDALLRQGPVPLPIARAAVLAELDRPPRRGR
jgi:uncharacterized protein (DUF885 family)